MVADLYLTLIDFLVPLNEYVPILFLYVSIGTDIFRGGGGISDYFFFFGMSDWDLARDFLFCLVSSSGGLLADLLDGPGDVEGLIFDLAKRFSS